MIKYTYISRNKVVRVKNQPFSGGNFGLRWKYFIRSLDQLINEFMIYDVTVLTDKFIQNAKIWTNSP